MSDPSAHTPAMNPIVTRVHSQEQRWGCEFAALRAMCLATGLQEQLKWGHACYTLVGANVVLIHGFKTYCALLFMKGALLKNEYGLLVQQTPNVQSARQMRFASVAQIEQSSAAVKATIQAAVHLELAGAKVVRQNPEALVLPEELQQQLRANPKLAKAFEQLTAGRRRAYALHVGSAKQSATRSARVSRHAPRILLGLGLDD